VRPAAGGALPPLTAAARHGRGFPEEEEGEGISSAALGEHFWCFSEHKINPLLLLPPLLSSPSSQPLPSLFSAPPSFLSAFPLHSCPPSTPVLSHLFLSSLSSKHPLPSRLPLNPSPPSSALSPSPSEPSPPFSPIYHFSEQLSVVAGLGVLQEQEGVQ